MSYDINLAIDAYSHSMGNREEALAEFCAEHSIADQMAGIQATIDELQGDLFDQIWALTRDNGPMTGDEIEALAERHCSERAPAVNSDGIAALMRWAVWMAWHEGCLR